MKGAPAHVIPLETCALITSRSLRSSGLFLLLEMIGHANDDYSLFEEECTFEH